MEPNQQRREENWALRLMTFPKFRTNEETRETCLKQIFSGKGGMCQNIESLNCKIHGHLFNCSCAQIGKPRN